MTPFENPTQLTLKDATTPLDRKTKSRTKSQEYEEVKSQNAEVLPWSMG